MMRSMCCVPALAALALSLYTAAPSNAAPPGTSFTYQGVLEQGGSAVDTAIDVRFTLWDDAAAGAQVGSPITVTVTPDAGVFSASVDFGATAFATNQALWVQIEVSPQGLGTFDDLGRQAIEGAPYSVSTRGFTVDASGNLDIGPANPGDFDSLDLNFNEEFVEIGQMNQSTGLNFIRMWDTPSLPTSNGQKMEISAPLALNVFVNGGQPSVRMSSSAIVVEENTQVNGSFLVFRDDDVTAPGVGKSFVSIGSSTYTQGGEALAALSVRTTDADSNDVLNGASVSFRADDFPTGGDNYWGVHRAQPIGGNKFFITYGTDQVVQNNATAMAITSDLDVGIGTDSPDSKLDVEYSTGNGIEVTDNSTNSFSVGVFASVGEGTGVRGESTATGGAHYGVYGSSASPAGWGVFSNGRLGAAGTKSFMIDHPLDPANKVLLHYSSESPEPQNRYNGTVFLNNAGAAAVQLPVYYQEINTNERYNLTAIGGPAPNLHVAQKVQNNVFVIAGGQPGQEISWEIIATRMDQFVLQRGAPVEMVKEPLDRGKFIMPELYGLPAEFGIHHKEAVAR